MMACVTVLDLRHVWGEETFECVTFVCEKVHATNETRLSDKTRHGPDLALALREMVDVGCFRTNCNTPITYIAGHGCQHRCVAIDRNRPDCTRVVRIDELQQSRG